VKIPVRKRSGYAMVLVIVFIVLFLAFLGVAYRQFGTALRVESVHSQQVQRDEGSLHALARALALLETGLPPTSPYSCGVTISTSRGPSVYTITFANEGSTNWSVRAAPRAPGDNPPPMPVTFAP
jgi:hypothetical protein